MGTYPDDEAQLNADLRHYLNEVRLNSDLEVVVYGAALIDEALSHRLRVEMIEGSDTVKSLLKPTGLLGSNAARLNVLYAFGKISKDLQDGAKVVAEIRNKFAHTRMKYSLENKSVRDELLKIKVLEYKIDGSKSDELNLRTWSGKDLYSLACLLLTMRISLDAGKIAADKAQNKTFLDYLDTIEDRLKEFGDDENKGMPNG